MTIPTTRRRRRVSRTWTLVLALLLVGLPTTLPAQEAPDELPVDSLLRAHSHELSERDGRLAGPGRDFLLGAARGTRFFVIGENHCWMEIPRITSMLFADLHDRRGYEYLATENGPYVMRRLSDPAVRGDTAASFTLADRYPSALHFGGDGEIEMFARVGAISDAPGDPLWGLDRPDGGTHVLERLAEAAPDTEARRRVEEVLAEARRYERPGGVEAEKDVDWIIDVTDREQLAGLRDALDPAPGSPADSMLRALELSNRTYRNYIRATQGEPTGYASNLEREQFMKRQLAFHLHAARRKGEELPRVLLKFGHWHARRGMNPGHVFPLGGFAASVAKLDGAKAFTVATGVADDGESPFARSDEYGALAAAGDPHGWRVVDFRPLRPLVHDDRVSGLTPGLEKWIFKFDAALLIGDGHWATSDRRDVCAN